MRVRVAVGGAALIALATACGSAPSLSLIGPSGTITGTRLSECTRGLFSSYCGDAFPSAAPAMVHVSGADGADLRIETNTPRAEASVRIEQGSFENRTLIDARSQEAIRSIHLNRSAEPYFVTINLDGGSGSTTAVFVVKVDSAGQ